MDESGRGLVTAPDPKQEDQLMPVRPNYASLRKNSLIQILKVVFGKPRVYNVTLSLDRDNQHFVTVQIGIRTTFLGNAFLPGLTEAGIYIGLAILISLIVSAFVANLALHPIVQISERLDALAHARRQENWKQAARQIPFCRFRTRSTAWAAACAMWKRYFPRSRRTSTRFSRICRTGMMLFTHDSRAVLVSRSVERFLSVDRDQVLGAEVHDIFDRNTVLGRTVRQAFDARMSIVQEEVVTEAGRRVEISLDFIHDDHGVSGDYSSRSQEHSLGALLTLHDLESMREIESELELSRRMAAIGRLTSGVGHEVKNPINAIVVHLELLRSKMDTDSPAVRHLDVIQSEIHRLDRVVQTLVDFSRPVELQLKDQDLRGIVSSVLMLASAELETHNITVVSQLPGRPVIAKVDSDLLKQALLNVVLNGAQAMPEGRRALGETHGRRADGDPESRGSR